MVPIRPIGRSRPPPKSTAKFASFDTAPARVAVPDVSELVGHHACGLLTAHGGGKAPRGGDSGVFRVSARRERVGLARFDDVVFRHRHVRRFDQFFGHPQQAGCRSCIGVARKDQPDFTPPSGNPKKPARAVMTPINMNVRATCADLPDRTGYNVTGSELKIMPDCGHIGR